MISIQQYSHCILSPLAPPRLSLMTLALSLTLAFAFELLCCLHQLLYNLMSSSVRTYISARSPFHKGQHIEDMGTAQVMSACDFAACITSSCY